DPEEIESFAQAGFLIRHSFQYHWKNAGYRDFADFLSTLQSRKRKQIEKEREAVRSRGVEIRTITGSELSLDHADRMTPFYQNTIFKMGATAYLTPAFFSEIFDRKPDQIRYLQASCRGEPVAGALFYLKGDKLFGRHWGTHDESLRFLHFEL